MTSSLPAAVSTDQSSSRFGPLARRACLSGLLLWTAFFPLNLGWTAWVALVPFLTLVRAEARPRILYSAAYLGGLACFIPALQWLRVAHPMMAFAWGFLAFYAALSFPTALWLLRRADRAGLPLTLSLPIVWVSLEYLRAHFPTGFDWLSRFDAQVPIGFAWYFLGHTQHDLLTLIQIADLTGVYGLSFSVALANAVVCCWVRTWAGGERAPWVGTASLALLLGATLVYGTMRLDHPPFPNGPTLSLLQGNLPQDVKNMRGEAMAKHFENLLLESLKVQPTADLTVWPETACPDDWYAVAPQTDPRTLTPEFRELLERRRSLAGWVRSHRAAMLLGLNSMEWADGTAWKYNSALLIDAAGIPQGRYDKMHLVPFGEYVPLRSTFPWLRVFTPYKWDYSCKPGERWERFALKTPQRTYTFGVLICYEDSDPTLARRYALADPQTDQPPVDFLINISNDGWFDGTEEHEQHLAICRFRAVESRRSIARAVNMGISAIIDGDGRIRALPAATWSASKKILAVVRGPIPLDERRSVYARWGDWLPIACGILLAIGLMGSFRRRSPS